GAHFVHAYYNNHMLWSETETADTVAVTVNINELAVGGKCVGAHEIIVGKNIFGMIFSGFLIVFSQRSVNICIIFRMRHYIIKKTNLFYSGGAAAADYRTLFNERDGFFESVLFGRTVKCFKVSSFHFSNHT